ncbi:MAG: hypothetical protein PVH40_05130 [Gemmatimonadales bacterium]|jgi:uncharacterized membrane protein YkvI
MAKASVFKRYFLPGFVFQSVVIAGGYGTGRELAEFFLAYGPLAGLLAMVFISTVIWSAVCAVSFEFARTFRSFEYRGFCINLLGRAWWLFEICLIVYLAIVLAVIAAAAGTILEETFSLHYAVGVIGIMTAVGFLVFKGSSTIERFLASWSFVLYAVYIALFIACYASFGQDIASNLTAEPVGTGWIVGGIKYAAYNLSMIPVILFPIRHMERRREAIGAGLLAGPIAMVPALLFYLAMIGQYPDIADRPVPANLLLETLGSKAFQVTFQIVLFGTLIETGTGMIHGINERIAAVFKEKGRDMPAGLRPTVALVLLVAGTLISGVGLTSLIARGYGTVTWGFLAIYVVPILTFGVWKIRRRQRAPGRTS